MNSSPLTSRTLVRSAALAALVSAASAWAAEPDAPRLDLDTVMEAMRDARQSPAAAVKVDPMLIALMRQRQNPAAPGSKPSSSGYLPAGVTLAGPRLRDGKVLVEAVSRADSNALAQQLSAMGATDVRNRGNVVSGWVAVQSMDRLGSLSAALSVRPAAGYALNSGAVRSQGDRVQQSKLARLAFGVNGAGTQVGILSDSWNSRGDAAAGVAAGELPGHGNPFGFNADVQVLKDQPAGAATDEGRAMGEIVHDVAPGSKLAFYAPDSYLDHAEGVRQLARAGSSVIVDDISWFGEPWYQANPIGTAASEVGAQFGAVVFTSAGNRQADSIEAEFAPGESQTLLSEGQAVGKWRLHRFANGQLTIPITLRASSSIIFALQWDEPFASASPAGVGATRDLDLFLFGDSSGTNVVAESAFDNLRGDAVEVISVALPGTPAPDATATFYLGLGAADGVPAGRNFKIIAFTQGAAPGDIGSGTVFNKSTIVGHANEASFITSCAVRYDQTGSGFNALVESFSSQGGFRQTLNAVGQPRAALNTRKPDVCSPDGVNTSFFSVGDFDGDGKPNFFGTSASAPHAAAVAALMQQAAGGPSGLAPPAIKSIMLDVARDMDNPLTPRRDFGYDVKTGAGYLNALDAVNRARLPVFGSPAKSDAAVD
jgi:Subtilase family